MTSTGAPGKRRSLKSSLTSWLINSACVCVTETYYQAKETYYQAKETYHQAKETYYTAKQTCYYTAKETY